MKFILILMAVSNVIFVTGWVRAIVSFLSFSCWNYLLSSFLFPLADCWKDCLGMIIRCNCDASCDCDSCFDWDFITILVWSIFQFFCFYYHIALCFHFFFRLANCWEGHVGVIIRHSSDASFNYDGPFGCDIYYHNWYNRLLLSLWFLLPIGLLLTFLGNNTRFGLRNNHFSWIIFVEPLLLLA